MIKFRYPADDGEVEVTFDTIADLEKFRGNRIKHIQEKEAEERELSEKKEREIEEKVAERWEELKGATKSLISKAREYGVSPKGVIELFGACLLEEATSSK